MTSGATARLPVFLRECLLDLASNLRAALALLAGREPQGQPLRTGPGRLLVLLLLYVLLDFGYDLLVVGLREGHFEPLAVPTVTFWALAALVSATLLALAAPGPAGPPTLALATAAFALACVGSVMASALAFLADALPPIDAAYGVLAWLPVVWVGTAYALAATRIVAPARLRARVAAFVFSLAVALAPQWFIDPSLRMWTVLDAADREAGANASLPQSEQAFYGQMDLLQDALDAIEPAAAGVPELYSITFAGDGGQDVFLSEARGAAAVLSDVFGGDGHGLVLANSRAHPGEEPFATASSLQRALAVIAERMNPDTDVLALVLTSHGTADHRLSVSLPPYRFEDLTPERLRELLDESGIRYRVIIVSACYAGGYVTPLASPDTMVITASAADRTSFGCRDGARWTDFGRAYFSEALRRTGSFESAFRIAEQDIAAREAREHLEPSRPQIFVGAAIREALQRLHTHRGEAMVASATAREFPHPGT